VTNASKVGSQAGKDVKEGTTKGGQEIQQGLGTLTGGLGSDTTQLTSPGTGWLQYIGNLVYDVLPRIAAGGFALILIAFGLWMIGHQPPKSTQGP
jgi:hypothetical protein